MRRLLGNRRILAGASLVLALVAVALWPTAVPVDVAPVVRGPLLVTIDEEGQTRVRERFVISAPVASRMERLDRQPGDPVARGATLVRLVPVDPALLDERSQAELTAAVASARAAAGQARAERARAEATVERARTTLDRLAGLERQGVVSRDEAEAAETTLRGAEETRRAAEFGVARAEHDLRMAQARLGQPRPGGRILDVVSPIDGVVLKRYRESEGVVPAGEPLLEVGDPARLEIVADLLSTDAVRVAPGARVIVEQWGGDDPLRGRVRRVEPSGFTKVSALGVEEQRVNVIVDLDDAEAGRSLGDGYRVEVRVVASEDRNVLKVPVTSLFRRGDGWAAFVLSGGRVVERAVSAGRRNALDVQIVDGLAEGELVVVHPPDTLRDGMRAGRRPA